MTEMQAAIGRIQLKIMPDWRGKRLNNGNKIWHMAKQCKGLRVPDISDYNKHAVYKYYVFVKSKGLKMIGIAIFLVKKLMRWACHAIQDLALKYI